VIAYMSETIGVLYRGRFVEIGRREEVVTQARHPYTQALMAANARPLDAGAVGMETSADTAAGCPFRLRCPHAVPRCAAEMPALRPVSETHHIACHLVLAAPLSTDGTG
jgi:oligopeptide/dipeptide ABC transporter ATP-binding protein